MKKLILREGVECVLNDDGKWTCLNKDVRGFTENYLNSITSVVLSRIGPSDGEPMTAAFYETGKEVKAIKLINTDKALGKSNPGTVN